MTHALVIWQAENVAGNSNKTEESNEEKPLDNSESIDPSSTSQDKLYNKLRAVEFEIDAVASTVDHVRSSTKEDNGIDDGGNMEQDDGEDDKSAVHASLNDMTLQHALTADRLKSLKKTKAQLVKELSHFPKGKTSKEHDKFIKDLVKEEHRPKRKSKEAQKPGKDRSKQQKTVSVDDDFDFDSVLDAASAGFVETVSQT